MGAEFIGMGMTVRDKFNLGVEEATTVVQEYAQQINEKIDLIDSAGAYTLDSYDSESAALEAILASIVEGAVWAHGDSRGASYWPIPGTDLVFLTSGGWSWGDPPFEEYDGAVLAGDACSEIPELGAKLGILGGGIRLQSAEPTEETSVGSEAGDVTS